MTTVSDPAVVVGVDGSAAGLSAVRLGAAEAARRHRPLRLVHAFVWPLLHIKVEAPAGGPADGGLRPQAEHLLAEAMAEADKAVPGLPVSGEIVDGQAATVLVGETTRAALVVLGDRGLGGFTSLLVGSVAAQVAEYADCPVVVARGTERGTGPVVVGVDGSALSALAVDFAAEAAAVRGTDLVAVHAFRHPVSTGPGDLVPLVYDAEELRAEEERVLAESIAGLTERYPQVPISRRLVRGRVAPTLIEASRSAQLVVVGSLGRGGFAGSVLGSVSRALLHHSSCPVAVVHHAR